MTSDTSKAPEPPVYSEFELMEYVGAAAERSLKAETSRVVDMDAEIRPTHISHLAIVTDNFDATFPILAVDFRQKH